ncbi:hypothetical protein PVAND_004148 [Polypedilum vanderplanki]|uniref:Uncharacterized protein n=1 Tax=Polypedilum vanderplanki TaxID=319348 RepID=A0A9J6BXB1_POLVA|nr:hypothetical protein PVAND_004148 [Polypedilum vanderplanki]
MFCFLKRKLIDFIPSILLLTLLNDEIKISHGSIVRTADYNGASETTNGITDLNAKRQSNGGGSGEIMKSTSLNLNEPSCEELRAMWQFSRRQSRASEITNEIPTYHDPFSMNVWDPYYPTRSLGGRRISSRYRYGPSGRPVYGRVVHQPTQQISIGGRYYDVSSPLERGRTNYEDFINIKPFSGPENILLGNHQQQQQTAKNRKQPKVRFGNGITGSSNSISGTPNLGQHAIFGSTGINQIAPQRGSFQRLKELVWTERARELSQQRKSEEIAARAAILKDITNGQHYKTSMSPSSSRRSKSGSSLNSNKNKLLKNESKGLNNKDDMQQLMSRSSSSYWSTNEKRSQQQTQQQQSAEATGNNNNIYIPLEESEPYVLADRSPSQNVNNNLEEVAYVEDDDDGSDYEINGFFNSINDDNINDFYFYINQLLNKKPNQKSI